MTWVLAPSPEEVRGLGDAALRELVIRCCEAELLAAGLSIAAVRAGGHQDASDGGVDVYVESVGVKLAFLPATPAGIQVKAEPMPASKIGTEMRPKGVARPILAELAAGRGGYLIAGGRDSATHRRREERETAMANAVADVPRRKQLRLSFFDATDLARWAGAYPSVSLWLGEASGNPRHGWRPYDRWSAPNSPAGEPYLPDAAARAHADRDPTPICIDEALSDLRTRLTEPGAVVRLVGLSGMGKTRFSQALFESGVGHGDALAPTLAVYCDVGGEGVTSPELVLEQALERKARAVFVVDNCNHVLHRRLATLASRPGSRISLLTIDFDVADDQPASTYVMRLRPASEQTVEQLIAMRFPRMGSRSRQRIAEFAGGNTRIAIALADATKGRAVYKLGDRELLDRLFLEGRRAPDDDLRRVARVLAMFGAIDLDAKHQDSEVAVVCRLADVSQPVFYSKLGDLLERGLAQQRGSQRAVLPQALAVWLAHEALARMDLKLIRTAIMEDGPPRLAKSFTKRLGELVESESARDLALDLLKPGGTMVPTSLADDDAWLHFRNLAPLAPDRALAIVKHAVECARPDDDIFRYLIRDRALRLLIDLAFDDRRFESAIEVLADLMVKLPADRRDESYRRDLLTLFQAQWAPTLATPARRFAVIERLICSEDRDRRALGVNALAAALAVQPRHHSHYSAFGARLPDAGWRFTTTEAHVRWFADAIGLSVRLAAKPEVAALLGPQLAKALGAMLGYKDVGPAAIAAFRSLTDGRFWRDGWFSVCNYMYGATNRRSALSKAVQTLEAEMRPMSVADRYEAWVQGDPSSWNPPTGRTKASFQESSEHAAVLGGECAADGLTYERVILRAFADSSARGFALGEGLARAATDPDGMWDRLVHDFASVSPTARNVTPLLGFLFEVSKREPCHVDRWLEAAVNSPELRPWTARLNTAPKHVGDSAARRMIQALRSGEVSAANFRAVGWGTSISNPLYAELVRALLAVPTGVAEAADILAMRYHFADKVPLDVELLQVGRETLEALYDRDDASLVQTDVVSIAKVCLVGPDGEASAKRLAKRLAHVDRSDVGHPWSENLPVLILANYPKVGLNAFLGGVRPLSSHYLDRVMLARDDDDNDPETSPLGRVDAAVVREWVSKKPATRAPRAAKVFNYRRTVDGKEVWTPLALWLLQLPGVTQAVGEVFEMRFVTGSWTGSTANRYLRRLPLAEALLGDPNTDIAAWARLALNRLLDQIEEVEEQERRSNARFE